MIQHSVCRRSFRNLAVVLVAVAVAGCSVALFPDKQPQRIFILPYSFNPAAGQDQISDSLPALKIARPRASGVLNSERIVIEPRPNELAAYRGVRWMTDAPVLLRDHLVRALRADPRTASVVSDTSGSGSDITLTSELLTFQEIRSTERPSIRLYLQAQLLENGSRRTLATRDFEVSAAVGSSDIEDVVAAFGQVSDRLSGELGDWIAQTLADY